MNMQWLYRKSLENGYIQNNIVQRPMWEEPGDVRTVSYIELPGDRAASGTELHARLLFDHAVNAHIDREWKSSVVALRLGIAGIGLAVVFGLLGLLLAWLKMDHRTGGSCRGRLSVGAVVAVLLLLVAAASVVFHLRSGMATPGLETVTATPVSSSSQPPADAMAGTPKMALVVFALPVGLLLLVGWAALLFSEKTRVPVLGITAIAIVTGLLLFLCNGRSSVGPSEILTLALSAGYLLLITVLSRCHWAWGLGMIGCMVAGITLTPPDSDRKLLAVAALCVVYTIVVFACKAGRHGCDQSDQRAEAVEAG